ncbi:MAG: Maf family protein [Sphingomonadales bacterium]|nr:Maf family protein [Sphingomonadales bacterium]
MTPPKLFLASQSSARARLLSAAAVPFEQVAAAIDEETVKDAMTGDQATPAEIAEALAELKAVKGSLRKRGALVLGCDQVLACDGKIYSKPRSLAEAHAQLLSLRGRRHELLTAAVIARDGRAIWRHLDRARLLMRDFSEHFLDDYLAAMGGAATSSVGGYEVEGLGAQLFAQIDGDHFSIQGLPLLPVLAILREHGVLTI